MIIVSLKMGNLYLANSYLELAKQIKISDENIKSNLIYFEAL